MAGRICKSTPNETAGPRIIKESRAYCEGRKAQLDGVLRINNPYRFRDVDAPHFVAWQDGWDDADAGEPKGCCAL